MVPRQVQTKVVLDFWLEQNWRCYDFRETRFSFPPTETRRFHIPTRFWETNTFCQISLKRADRYLWKFHKFGISGIPTHIQNIYTPILLNLEKIDKCPSMSRKKHKLEFYRHGMYIWPNISSSRFSIPIDINSCKKVFFTYLILSHIYGFERRNLDYF